MKKITAFLLFFSVLGGMFTSCTKRQTSENRAKEVVVYAYDSFVGEWGPGPALKAGFEAATGYTLTFVDCGDAGEVFARAILEKDAVQADVYLGIDNMLAPRAAAERILASYRTAETGIPQKLYDALGANELLTPYDWSYFTLMYDTQSKLPAPQTLTDLTKPEYARQLIVMDPRTSTPGLGFLAWTLATAQDGYPAFWKALKPALLTMAPGWSSGYGMFTSGEAPLVVSYVTSAAYHLEYDKTDRYRPLVFAEGHIMQVEGAGIANGAPNRTGGEAFIDYLVSAEGQERLPLTQWMYPANSDALLPDSYRALPEITNTLIVSPKAVQEAIPAVTDILAAR